MDSNKLPTADSMKRQANGLKNKGIPHHKALDEVANSYGFSNWRHLCNRKESLLSSGSMTRSKKQEEIWAEEYLRFQGFKNIEFEPDGNRTPDFLINGRIAVEVRRLNQYVGTAPGRMEGVEAKEKPFIDTLQKLLSSFGPPQNEVCWYVSCTFERPLPEKTWQNTLRTRLLQLDDSQLTEEIIRIDDHLSFSLTRSKNPKISERFIMGGYLDHDAGGFVKPELEKSLNLCISEKTAKTAPYRANYPEWWLILVDFMMVGQKKPVHIAHTFDKVIVIHPGNYANAYEL